MGFFSWNCNECKHPLLSIYAVNSINSWMQEAVVIEANTGRFMRGTYDGYGRVDGREIDFDQDPCCYHEACWLKADKPGYTQASEMAEDQGYFFDDEHNIDPPR